MELKLINYKLYNKEFFEAVIEKNLINVNTKYFLEIYDIIDDIILKVKHKKSIVILFANSTKLITKKYFVITEISDTHFNIKTYIKWNKCINKLSYQDFLDSKFLKDYGNFKINSYKLFIFLFKEITKANFKFPIKYLFEEFKHYKNNKIEYEIYR